MLLINILHQGDNITSEFSFTQIYTANKYHGVVQSIKLKVLYPMHAQGWRKQFYIGQANVNIKFWDVWKTELPI